MRHRISGIRVDARFSERVFLNLNLKETIMCRRLTYLISFVVMLSVAGNASADLVAHWRLDDGSGTVALDSSGNGNDGTVNGNAQWVVGQRGGALQFNGADVEVRAPHIPFDNRTFTVAMWVNAVLYTGEQCVFTQNESGTTNLSLHFRLGGPGSGNVPAGGVRMGFYSNDLDTAGGMIEENTWYHIIFWYDYENQNRRIYINGVLAAEAGAGPYLGTSGDTVIGRWDINNQWFRGIIDDVQVYDHALTEGEIQASMLGLGGYPYAFGPDPADGALHEDTWVTLSWKAGDFAVSHDVYLGDNYDDVSNATPDSDVFRGNQVTTFFVAGFPGFAYPDGLVPGTTYYWRIDEVNDADPNSPWKGDIWSLSIPPKTAYNPDPADGAESVDPNAPMLSWTPGFGAKLHTVYFGDDFDTVSDAVGGMPGGLTTYSPGPLELEEVYYWRVDEFDAIATYKGDVWSFTTPGAVGNPQPSYAATDVAMNATLSWTAAASAASHELYFGTDQEAVRNADTGSPEHKGSKALGAESYDPGLLDADTAYYWRVDEVDGQGNTAKGPLWIFTTGVFLLVDDFEGYTDDDVAGEAIWQTWIDGFGVADNGAQAGNLMPPYAEQTIVHGGLQSMPLLYVNEAGVTNSEASMTLTAPRDWTQAGVGKLSLWFRGLSSNAAEPLYVAISNPAGAPAVAAYDDPDAAATSTWMEFVVPLQVFADQGITLTNVDKIAIGLGSRGGAAAGGSGTMYIDDIRLYRPAP